MKPVFYKIEKGIPLPTTRRAGSFKDALARLRIGDSMLVPVTKRNTAFIRAAELGIKITTRCEEGGVRVWRISK